jgi:predicted Zn-dependent protease
MQVSKEGKPNKPDHVVPLDEINRPPVTPTASLNQATIESSFTEQNIFKLLSGEITSAELLGFTDEDAMGFAKYAYDFYSNGRFVDAARVFANLVVMKPDNAYFHAMWGACLQMLDEPERALRAYDNAIQLDPNNMAARVNRADLLLQKADFQPALADLEHIVKADPEGKNAATLRARALAQSTSQALKAFGEFLAQSKKS